MSKFRPCGGHYLVASERGVDPRRGDLAWVLVLSGALWAACSSTNLGSAQGAETPVAEIQQREVKPEPLDVRRFERDLRSAQKADRLDDAIALIQNLGDPPLVRSKADLGRLVSALDRVLRQRSDDRNASLQQATLLALGRCGEQGGEALDRALWNMGLRNRLRVQATVYEALGFTGEKRRLPQLVGALRPFSPEIAISAVRGLSTLLQRTDLPLSDWEQAAKEVEGYRLDLVRRVQDPASYPPPPSVFGDPLPWPSRERVAASLLDYETAQRTLVAAIRAREDREGAAGHPPVGRKDK